MPRDTFQSISSNSSPKISLNCLTIWSLIHKVYGYSINGNIKKYSSRRMNARKKHYLSTKGSLIKPRIKVSLFEIGRKESVGGSPHSTQIPSPKPFGFVFWFHLNVAIFCSFSIVISSLEYVL